MRYRTIVADPPWEITRRIGAGGRRANVTEVPYSFMSIPEIKALDVASLAEGDAHLYLWTTRSLFREGTAAAVVRAWGFEPCGEIIWGHRNPGTGSGPLVNDHEPVLIARRGSLPFLGGYAPAGVWFWKQTYIRKPGQRVPQKDHSSKPPGLQDLVETYSPGPFLELFARRQRLGWDTWGDEALPHTELAS